MICEVFPINPGPLTVSEADIVVSRSVGFFISVYRPLTASAVVGAVTSTFLVGASRNTLLSYSAPTWNEGVARQLLLEPPRLELFDLGAEVELCWVCTARGAGAWAKATFTNDVKHAGTRNRWQTHEKRSRMSSIRVVRPSGSGATFFELNCDRSAGSQHVPCQITGSDVEL